MTKQPPHDHLAPKNSFTRTTVIFTIVGLCASGSHFLLAALLHTRFGVDLIKANICGFSISFVLSYLGHHRFSFRSNRTHRTAFPMYVVTAFSGFSANTAAVYAQIKWFGAEYIWFIPVGITCGAVVVFLASKYWAFADKRR